ncbi:MAG: hypothetical protein ACRDSZ_03720 [Pseudonocardiaceae bacterium]
MRRWEGGISELGRTHSGIVLATVHVRAGEPGGLQLAHGAITAVTKLSSVRALFFSALPRRCTRRRAAG